MKTKFILLSSLLLFSRGCDFYSTKLWYFQDQGFQDETNPLSSILGFDWSGLIIVNLIIVSLIIVAYYIYCFRYKPKLQGDIKPKNYKEYISLLYYGVPGKFNHLFYRIPKFKYPAIAHGGYIMVRALIIASFLATIHNLCQFYNVEIYSQFREIVRRPSFVIYGLIFLSFLLIALRLFQQEYKQFEFKE